MLLLLLLFIQQQQPRKKTAVTDALFGRTTHKYTNIYFCEKGLIFRVILFDQAKEEQKKESLRSAI